MHTPNPTVFSKTRSLGFTARPRQNCFARRSAAKVENAWNKRSSTITENALMFEPGACFAAGTLVHTKEGLKPIEKIQVGDWVLSKPENGGERAYKRVLKTFAHEPQRVLLAQYLVPGQNVEALISKAQPIKVEKLVTTPGHPFWIKERGWTAAIKIQDEGPKNFRFEGQDGSDIAVWGMKSIYVSNHKNVGWMPTTSSVNTEDVGWLWDYVKDSLVAYDVGAIEAVQYAWDVGDPEEQDLYFKLPVYNLEVENFHTYYVGEHGIWVHNQNCDGQ
ncbi:MAG: polymorphic toxin-type HINT domain-containing protein, partial [Burkholderiaceae bacterium]